ncbi:hypothetical protein [Ktedonospora formicarum]|uniref:Uncharacterized protein n=1 Tax=Ktedonospora formicarum TaxID=2778364 RepID=A0A8J3MX97_9CHLR|nr:hypothetical protein [Ktedonospora formicarum]GHO48335.1 hypothetical protein KSX_64980 [Ktedonospora formicarum]
MGTCKKCGAQLTGRANQQFCDNKNKCKMAYWREQHKQDQTQGATLTETLSELADLRAKEEDQKRIIQEQAQRLEEQEQELFQIRRKLDVDRWYHKDTQVRGFKGWLRKQSQQVRGDLGQRILADDLLLLRGSRAGYESRMRSQHYSQEDLQEFAHLWKLMLLDGYS